MYVGVTLSSADRNLRLVVPECWATPTNDPNEDPKYYFIEQKYVSADQEYAYVATLIPIPLYILLNI